MKIFNWVLNKNNKEESKLIRQKVDGAFINASLNKVSKEIESLRKYDKGEKEIHAPNLRDLVRNLQQPAR